MGGKLAFYFLSYYMMLDVTRLCNADRQDASKKMVKILAVVEEL